MSSKRVRRIRKTNDLVYFESSLQENDANVDTKKSLVEKTSTPVSFPLLKVIPPTNENWFENNKGKRKIVKAKRLINKQKVDDKLTEKCEENVNSVHQKTCDINKTPLVDQEKPEEINKSNDFKVTLSNIVVSPSCGEDIAVSQFDSFKEELHPSTNGTIETSKRRTYELEDSVINISDLKSLSTRDSTRLNSFKNDESSAQCQTPPVRYSKITVRRKWNKCHDFSPPIYSPKWLNKCTKSLKTNKENTSPAIKKDSSAAKKFISKIKVPNFAAIHQKALEKIEDISEYKQRKDERAKLLLSGLKPTPLQQTSEKTSKKQLRFAANSTLRAKSPTFIPLPSTPAPRHGLCTKINSPVKLDSSNPFNFKLDVQSKLIVSPLVEQKPWEKILTKNNVKPNIFNFNLNKKNTAVSPVTSVQKSWEKKVFVFKNKDVKNKLHNELQSNKIKSIVTKSKPAKNVREERRCVIKGVRSNRRFELLMDMRKGK